jgi:hypothetical protein
LAAATPTSTRRPQSSGERAAGERCLVGAGLDRLAGRLAQRLLDVGRRRHRRDPHGDDLEPELAERRLARQPGGDAVADRRDAPGEDRAQVEPHELVDHELLGELGEQRRHLLERRLRPRAVGELDGEVDAPCEQPRVGDPERNRALHGQLLEVGRAGVEQQRQLAVVDRDLGHRGVDGAEPEREPGAVATAVVEHVRGGLGAEVADEGIGGDLGHGDRPLLYWSVRPIQHV